MHIFCYNIFYIMIYILVLITRILIITKITIQFEFYSLLIIFQGNNMYNYQIICSVFLSFWSLFYLIMFYHTYILFCCIEQIVSVFLAVSATIACVSACVFSAMHLSHLMGLECTPAQVLNATCVCRPRGEPPDSLEGAVRYVM